MNFNFDFFRNVYLSRPGALILPNKILLINRTELLCHSITETGAASHRSLSLRIYTFRVLIIISTEEPALNCPDNLSLTQEVTGHTYSRLVSLLPPLHQVAKY